MLGEAVANRFGELPFLFKVLCAAQPLSIQVHPKELVFALTPFLAMNAFREFSDIVSLLQPVAGAHSAIAHFLQAPNAERLSQLFASLSIILTTAGFSLLCC